MHARARRQWLRRLWQLRVSGAAESKHASATSGNSSKGVACPPPAQVVGDKARRRSPPSASVLPCLAHFTNSEGTRVLDADVLSGQRSALMPSIPSIQICASFNPASTQYVPLFPPPCLPSLPSKSVLHPTQRQPNNVPLFPPPCPQPTLPTASLAALADLVESTRDAPESKPVHLMFIPCNDIIVFGI